MKLIALLPASVFLISLCSPNLPELPADVSGSVFLDANRNGIRDSCDGLPPLGRYVVLTNDEITLKEPAARPDGFQFSDVPPGDYVLSLAAPRGSFWPVTTAPEGEFDMVVTVKGKDISGLELGVATHSSLPKGPHLLGLAYEDADGDGAISPGECGIEGSYVMSFPSRFKPVEGLFLGAAGSFQLASDTAVFPPMTVIPGGTNESWWSQTSPPAETGQCASPVAPQPRYAEDAFELNVGFQLAHGSASVTGVLFFDSDEDGTQDEEERLLDGAVQLVLPCTGDHLPLVTAYSTGADGYEFTGLSAGDYVVTIYDRHSFMFDAMPVLRERHVTVTEGARATADFPHRVVPSGTLIVRVFADWNENGQFDGDRPEPFIGNAPACYRQIDGGDDDWCVEPREAVEGIPLPAGTYEVYIPYTDGPGPSQTVEIRAGETATVYFPQPTASP